MLAPHQSSPRSPGGGGPPPDLIRGQWRGLLRPARGARGEGDRRALLGGGGAVIHFQSSLVRHSLGEGGKRKPRLVTAASSLIRARLALLDCAFSVPKQRHNVKKRRTKKVHTIVQTHVLIHAARLCIKVLAERGECMIPGFSDPSTRRCDGWRKICIRGLAHRNRCGCLLLRNLQNLDGGCVADLGAAL